MSGIVNDNKGRSSGTVKSTAVTAYDDDKLQTNVALLGFKTAVNGSLAKYSLQDQIVDEFVDTSGIDASASTNENRSTSAPYFYKGAVGTNPTGGTITTPVSGYRQHTFTSNGSLVATSSGNVDILVVAGGGAGGQPRGGGGGAGGLVYKTGHGLTANTYDAVIGAGGTGCASGSSSCKGGSGADSTWTINGGSTEFTAKGGGGAGYEGQTGINGGSGGANGYNPSGNGTQTQTGQSGDSGTYGFGNNGAIGSYAPTYNSGGGGGSGGAGTNASTTNGGAGGIGKDFSAIYGSSVGDSGWFASGGGGNAATGTAGSASNGGGTAGETTADVAANTGGGSGGNSNSNPGTGDGGSGIVIVRYATAAFETIANLTLQSTDTTAAAVPTKADMIILMEDADGTATINTDIKGFVSRDSGSNFTEGTLVNEGSWGTNKKILAFHDLDISGQPSGTSMCYKITTHNQSAGSKQTNIHATSIGWK